MRLNTGWIEMDVVGLASFTNALKEVQKTKGYINSQEGRFFVVSTKNEKNMNTGTISNKAKEALSCIESAPLSYKEGARSYKELADGLKGYIDRVYAQKTVIQKLAWWLGLSSEEEKSLYRSYQDARSYSKWLGSQDKKMQSQIVFQREALREADPQAMLYMSVFDSSRLVIPALYGAPASVVTNWMLAYLREYAAKYPEASPEREKLERVCEKMDKMLELSLVEDILRCIHQDPLLQYFMPDNIQDWLEKNLVSNIHTLSPGESFSFQGGYSKSASGGAGGHAVQYNFVAQPDNTFSLIFFNSGEGSHGRVHKEAHTPTALGFFEKFFYSEYVTSEKTKVLVHDYRWDNIPREAITQDFMQLLLEAKITTVATRMGEIHTRVTSYLKKFNVECKTDPVGHKPQKKGSCTVKSLALLLKNELGESLWHDFKLFYTDSQLSHFDTITKRLSPTDTQILTEDMEQIRKKRYQKAHPSSPSVTEDQTKPGWSLWNLFK